MGGRQDYEERREQRIERYKQLSAKAKEKSEVYSNSNANRILQLTPGQPILVGHHSEKRHRKLLEKASSDIKKSIEMDEKSDYYERRAESASNSKVIYNDDPNAIEKLKDKLERLEHERENIKKREHSQWELTNIGATIRETKKRIQRLEEQEKIVFNDIEFDGGKVVHNKELNRIQFLFDSIPDSETRDVLKHNGFHWSRTEQAWQRLFNQRTIYVVNDIVKEHLNKVEKIEKQDEEDEEFE